jgi:DnaJ-class molecular chaperone
LGVTPDASDADLKKAYRKLALKYHPDKNVHRTQTEREHCEQQFKHIQEAYSMIGTEQERKKFDSMSYFQRRQQEYNRRENNYPHTEFRRGRSMAMGKRAFYVNGVDISHLFDHVTSRTTGFGSDIHTFPYNPYHDEAMQYQPFLSNSYRSIFVQKITVPLADLYTGIKRQKFQLKDTIVQRYRAAFRGGIATQIGLQSLLTALPLLFRVSWVVSLIGFLATFHLSLPRPSRLSYYSQLRAGWKGGTKIKFQSVEPGLDVIFIIQEGRHDRFHREGNNLITSVKIGRSKAIKGCTLIVEPLGSKEMPVTVQLKPGEITGDANHHTVTLIGRGWPKAGGGAGDMIIHVNVMTDDVEEPRPRNKQRVGNI